MTEKISVTRALSEIKTIEARIRARIQESSFAAIAQGSRTATNAGVEISKFESSAASAERSIRDLFDRYTKLKAAIVQSNAVTRVTIAGAALTVAEAIHQKKVALLKRIYANKLRSDLALCEKSAQTENDKIEERLERLVSEILKATGKDPSKDRGAAIEYERSYRAENAYKIIDPLKLRDLIDKLEKEIDAFTGEVDFVLSESNSRTDIQIG